MKTVIIGTLAGLFLATSAIAHPGLSVGIDVATSDSTMLSKYHEIYNNTTYDNADRHNVSAKYIGPSLKYDFLICDFGEIGQLGGDLHTFYRLNVGGSKTETDSYNTYVYRFGNQLGGGIGVKLHHIAGSQISLGVDGDWVGTSLITKDAYNDYTSFSHRRADGFSWGPTISWDINQNWTIEGHVAFTSFSASSDSGNGPNDVWMQSRAAKSKLFMFRFSRDLGF